MTTGPPVIWPLMLFQCSVSVFNEVMTFEIQLHNIIIIHCCDVHPIWRAQQYWPCKATSWPSQGPRRPELVAEHPVLPPSAPGLMVPQSYSEGFCRTPSSAPSTAASAITRKSSLPGIASLSSLTSVSASLAICRPVFSDSTQRCPRKRSRNDRAAPNPELIRGLGSVLADGAACLDV